jgi:hypothetical protein
MRWVPFALFVTAGWWTWHAWEEGRSDPVGEAPAVSSAPAARDGSAFPMGWEKAEPTPDPLVHCRMDDEGVFLRTSECERRGGVVDEPDWARLR